MSSAFDPRRHPGLLLGLALLAGLGAWALARDPATPTAGVTAGVAAVMAVAWVTEAVPLYATALLPLAAFPALGIATPATTASAYGKPTIFLFLGGFILALGLMRSGLHRRVAFSIAAAVGSRPARLVLGFMLATGLLSMWISNTAAVMVMLPIALSLLEEARAQPDGEEGARRLGPALMLGIAYAADIGGMATPVGTPPNLVLQQMIVELLPGTPAPGFGTWLAMGLPLSATFLASGWWLLTRRLFPLPETPLLGGQEVVRAARDQLGRVRRDELVAGGVFLLVAVLWVTGDDLRLGEGFRLAGWRSRTGLSGVDDAALAVGGGLLLFLLPSGDRPGERLLAWEDTQQLPWGVLLLFGGGFALADAFQSSGLSAQVGRSLSHLAGWPPLALVAVVCLVLTFLTELTSNTATTTLVLPILAEAGHALGVDPRALMIPATLSASCAFMMPVASPTQAIVFGSGQVTIRQMVRAGLWFNALGVALVTIVFAVTAGPLFGIAL